VTNFAQSCSNEAYAAAVTAVRRLLKPFVRQGFEYVMVVNSDGFECVEFSKQTRAARRWVASWDAEKLIEVEPPTESEWTERFKRAEAEAFKLRLSRPSDAKYVIAEGGATAVLTKPTLA